MGNHFAPPQCNTCRKGVSLKRNDLPVNLLFLGFFGWFIDLSVPAKIAVIAGTVVFLIAVCCGCCCYCCCRSRRSANQGPIIIAPGVGTSAVMTTNANTRVPMRPLVEEEWAPTSSQVLRIVSPNAALSPHYTQPNLFSPFLCDELTVKSTIYRLK